MPTSTATTKKWKQTIHDFMDSNELKLWLNFWFWMSTALQRFNKALPCVVSHGGFIVVMSLSDLITVQPITGNNSIQVRYLNIQGHLDKQAGYYLSIGRSKQTENQWRNVWCPHCRNKWSGLKHVPKIEYLK